MQFGRSGVIVDKDQSVSQLSKRCTTRALSQPSRCAFSLRLLCKTCKSNLQLKEKYPRQLHRRYRTLLYPPSSRNELAVFFYTTRIERGAKIINFRLTNEFVLNYEYSNGEGNVTNFIEPADDLMTVAVVLSVAYCACAAHFNRLLTVLTDTRPPKFNPSRVRSDEANRFRLAHWAINLSSLGVVLRGLPDCGHSSIIQVACRPCIRRLVTEWYTPHFPCNPSIAKTCL